jgi:hypothetical protein
MNEPKTWCEWLDALNKSLAMDEWHVNQLYLAQLEGEACHIMGVHQHIFERSSTFLSLQNLFSSSGLVKISVSWSSVPTFYIEMSPFYWWSLVKWWRTFMCFVLACWTGLLVSFMPLLLSHSNGTLLSLILKSFKVASIQSICAQQLPAVMYSASVVESVTLFCFLYDHATSDLPNSWHVPEVLLLSTLHPA